jgi:sigma-70, region 4
MVICKENTEDIIQCRFTAYLKTSVSHQRSRYLAKLHERQNIELFYEEYTEVLNQIQYCSQETYLQDEIEDARLSDVLNKLRERDRSIVFRRAVFAEPFIKIAEDMGLKYVTVKAIYRRALEKIRKEMLKK